MSEMPRVRTSSMVDDVFMYASVIKDIPRIKTEAIAAFLGDGHDRIFHVIERWRRGSFEHLFISGLGMVKGFDGAPLTHEALCRPPFKLPLNFRTVVVSERSDNTATDAKWLAEQMASRGIRSVTLTTCGSHLTRSYLTLLKSLKRRNWQAIVIPEPTLIRTREDLILLAKRHTGEFDRIIAYQERQDSDLASKEEFLEYMAWLYEVLEDPRSFHAAPW